MGSPHEDDTVAPRSDGRGSDRTDVVEPAKALRLGQMAKQLLDELRGDGYDATSLDEATRDRLRHIHERSVSELAAVLSPELRDELHDLTPPFTGDDPPSGAELKVVQAQLVGWLEGLFHGVRAAMMADQLARHGGDRPGGPVPINPPDQPGRYL